MSRDDDPTARYACCIARSFVTDFSVYFCSTEAGFFTLPRHRRRAERGRAPAPQWSRWSRRSWRRWVVSHACRRRTGAVWGRRSRVAAANATQQAVGRWKRVTHSPPPLRGAVVEHHVDRSGQVRALVTGNGYHVRAALKNRLIERPVLRPEQVRRRLRMRELGQRRRLGHALDRDRHALVGQDVEHLVGKLVAVKMRG